MDRFDPSIKAVAQAAFDVSYATWMIIISTQHLTETFLHNSKRAISIYKSTHLIICERKRREEEMMEGREREKESDLIPGFDGIVAMAVCGSRVNRTDAGKQREALRKTRQWELQPS